MNNELILNKNPKSAFSEAIRIIRTNLEFSTLNSNVKVILITSPEPGDGKSLIAANLALAYSLDNKKVLLIDADLRKGHQYKIFDMPKSNEYGYTNLILNYKTSVSPFEYIYQTRYTDLFLLQNGIIPPNPIELLSSKKNKILLDRLKKEFDIIILDCPPVLGLSDTLVMTKYSDANIVTVSNKKTTMEQIKEVKKVFEKSNVKITGVVFNRADRKKSSYYRYYE